MAIGRIAWLSMPVWMSVLLDRGQLYVAFAAMAVFASAAIGMQFFVRCPRCKVRLGQIGVQVGISFLKPTVNFCPCCGVSLDEPRASDYPRPAQAAHAVVQHDPDCDRLFRFRAPSVDAARS
jgi:hypothetical protein